jgi:hypothetical protein
MATIRICAECTVAGSAGAVYGYIADMREHHPRFLPPAFSDFQVESGGVGEGTIMRFTVTAGGRTRQYRMKVAEPEPGKPWEAYRPASPCTPARIPARQPAGLTCPDARTRTTWRQERGIARATLDEPIVAGQEHCPEAASPRAPAKPSVRRHVRSFRRWCVWPCNLVDPAWLRYPRRRAGEESCGSRF